MKFRSALALAPMVCLTLSLSTPGLGSTLYSNGFEANTTDWTNTTRVASGTNGVPSADGSFHGEITLNGFTRWSAYNTSTGGLNGPFQPYTTSLDIYLNVSGGASNDSRFDFTSAINNSSGTHRRDFAFNVGFYNSSDGTGPGAGTDRFIISASNNTGEANSFPKNPARAPIAITSSGWYTFEHSFSDNGGTLLATLRLLDSTSGVLATWLLSDPSDLIGLIGGNRYGWFPQLDFSFLAIDNASLTGVDPVPVPLALPLFASGLGLMGVLAWRKRKRSLQPEPL